MNPIERLELHCEAMQRKYGMLYSLYMNKEELAKNNLLIAQRDSYLKRKRDNFK